MLLTDKLSKDRQDAVRWARSILAPGRDQIIILDSETSDLYGVIIELAIINLQGYPLFNSRLALPDDGHEISPGAKGVHGISREDLQNAPSFPDVYPTIAAVIGRAELVLIYNADYDAERLDYTIRVHNLDPISYYPRYCVMREYAKYYGQWNDYHQSYTWQKLTGGDHSALGDCRATLDLIEKMASEDG